MVSKLTISNSIASSTNFGNRRTRRSNTEVSQINMLLTGVQVENRKRATCKKHVALANFSIASPCSSITKIGTARYGIAYSRVEYLIIGVALQCLLHSTVRHCDVTTRQQLT